LQRSGLGGSDPAEAAVLAEALAHGWPKLWTLDLRFNNIKDAGAKRWQRWG
jgi:hypothetical protein